MRNSVNAQKPVLKFPDILVCGACNQRFPHGAWAEHLLNCSVAPAQDRSAEILEGLSRRLADLTAVATYKPL